MAPASDLPLDPARFSAQFDGAARLAGFRPEPLGETHGLPLRAYTKRTAGPRPRVYLSAGIHGDEPAPPWSMLRLMTEGFFDGHCNWFLCPLLNPAGFTRQSRENLEKIDLNRDYKSRASPEVRAHIAWLQRQPAFDFVLCLHEDWEATGFYLYELNPENRSTLTNAMIAAARQVGPIEPATVIDGRPIAEPGIIRPVSDPLLRETWPESIYLRQHHTRLTYTIETASGQPLEQRVDTQCAVVRAAIAEFSR